MSFQKRFSSRNLDRFCMNKISVIIPTYQHAHTIERCVDSVLNQSRKADEIIIVDDGSTDGSAEILKKFDSSIKVVGQSNQGAPKARNNGFKLSSGSMVLFCDADVIMQEGMLKSLELALESDSDAGYSYSGFLWGWKKFRSYPFSKERLKKMNFVHTSALIRRDAFPGFDEVLKRFQDWDLWLTILEGGKRGVFVNEILYQVLKDDEKSRISKWLPSPLVRFPWKLFGWSPKVVQSYNNAKEIIINKHGLDNK
jgi:glycosyltransferase involved in cell wall biosynthesis